MSDSKDLWSGVDEPRDVPDDVKSRIVERISKPAPSADGFTLLDDLDLPRPLPVEMGWRITTTIVGQGRRMRGVFYAAVSAVVAMAIIASTTFIASKDRFRFDGDASLVAFSSADEFREYMSSRAVIAGFTYAQEYSRGGPRLGESSAKRVVNGLLGLGRGQSLQSDSSVGREVALSAPESGPASGPANDEFSTTNVQEMGVDEPDLIKTDGTILVALASGKLWVLDVTGDKPVLKGSLPFPGQRPTPAYEDRVASGGISLSPIGGPVEDGQMFLAANRVIHISQTYSSKAETKVTVISIEDPAKPKITSETTLEGSLIGARMSNGAVRLILRSTPGPDLKTPGVEQPPLPLPVPAPAQDLPLPEFENPTPEDVSKTVEENKKIIEEAKPEEWVPDFKVVTSGVAVEGKIHSWEQVKRPSEFSGLSMLSVVTLDPANPSPKNSVSIVGAGEIVYSSTENLYVTTQLSTENIVIVPRGERVPSLPPGVKAIRPEDFRIATQIHKFSISQPGAAVYRSSGEVEGTALNQFSMSEKDGYLRIATTRQQFSEGSQSESFVTVMQDKGDKLVAVGSVGNLGKGEQIYAVRFIGDAGYVVTFRQTDPLYVIDLRDPAHPAIRGELKIPGFSNYLHPVGDHLLLGIGQDGDEQGRVKGLQVSLFDVSDPAKPARLHQKTLGKGFGSSEAQFDHHAFLYWPKTGLLVVPVNSYNENGPGFSGAMALQVDEVKGFSEATEITHVGKVGTSSSGDGELSFPEGIGPQIRRSVVVKQNLVTYSTAGLLTNELTSLRERVWVPFIS
ncbi:MAG: beta-propeller domain-containing protein [Actinomycetota bacterium]